MSWRTTLWERRSLLIFVLTPLLLLPLPLALPRPEAQVAYVMLIMAVYWVSEALPIGVTALIPVFAIPAFKIVTSKDLCPSYFEDSNMLFIGGLMLAISVEFWNLHKRIALLVLKFVGVQPRWLLLGFMGPTWFMSMWISNTATSAMMLPIVDAVLQELMLHHKRGRQEAASTSAEMEMSERGDASDAGSETPEDEQQQPEQQPEKQLNALEYMQVKGNEDFAGICKMLTISVAYAANIGGTATLTGTAPNLVLNNNIESGFGSDHKFGFATWMAYALPISLVVVLLAWLWLQLLFLGPRNFVKCRGPEGQNLDSVKKIIDDEYKNLGPITYPEVTCIVVFLITIVMWIFRSPGFSAWGSLFETREFNVTGNGETKVTSYMADAQPAILMSILLFVLPSSNPFKSREVIVDIVVEESAADEAGEQRLTKRQVKSDYADRPKTMLTWQVVHQRLPWGIVLLLGGGFALAKATKDSGLSILIGQQLQPIGQLPPPLLTIIIIYATNLVTEITSNTATASILLPILLEMGRSIEMNPFALMLPCTVACSLAFNLPVATPPNSIVFSKGYLTVPDMMKSGFVLTLISGLVVLLGSFLHGPAIFEFWTYPDWAKGYGIASEWREAPNFMPIGNE